VAVVHPAPETLRLSPQCPTITSRTAERDLPGLACTRYAHRGRPAASANDIRSVEMDPQPISGLSDKRWGLSTLDICAASSVSATYYGRKPSCWLVQSLNRRVRLLRWRFLGPRRSAPGDAPMTPRSCHRRAWPLAGRSRGASACAGKRLGICRPVSVPFGLQVWQWMVRVVGPSSLSRKYSTECDELSMHPSETRQIYSKLWYHRPRPSPSHPATRERETYHGVHNEAIGHPKALPKLNVDGAGRNRASVSVYKVSYIRKFWWTQWALHRFVTPTPTAP